MQIGRAKVQIPLEHLQVFVARAKLHFGDAVALFEQAADRLMADVVKVKVACSAVVELPLTEPRVIVVAS